MAHNPLSIVTLGMLAPAGTGSGERVVLQGLTAELVDGQMSASLEDGRVNVQTTNRTPLITSIKDRKLVSET